MLVHVDDDDSDAPEKEGQASFQPGKADADLFLDHFYYT